MLVGLVNDAGQAEALVKRFAQQPSHALASNTQHKGFASNIHAVILVGDATNQRRYQGVSGAPTRYLCQNVLDSLIYGSPPLLATGSLLH